MSEQQQEKHAVQIAQINARRMRDLTAYMQWAKDANVDILVIVEYARSDKHTLLRTYSLDSDEALVAVIVISEIDVTPKFISYNHIVIKIEGLAVNLHAWYINPRKSERSKRTDDSNFEELIEHLVRERRKTIHMGDLNAHATELGDKADKRGRNLISAIANIWGIANTPGVKTFRNNKGTAVTTPDWVIHSKDLEGRVSWKTERDELGSDHDIVIITLLGCKVDREQEVKKVVSPAKFLREAKISPKKLENWEEEFAKAVEKATVIKKVREKELPENLKYMKEAYDTLRSRINKAKGGLNHRHQELIGLGKEYKRMLREWKEREESESIASATTKDVYKKIKKSRAGMKRIDHVEVNNEILTGREAGKAVLRVLFPDETEEEVRVTTQTADDVKPITVDEMKIALNSFRPDAAPGMDGVDIRLIRKWFNQEETYLNDLFNDWYKKAIFPKALKKGLMIPLLKPGQVKPDPAKVRPIVIPSALGKWYEKCLDERVMYYMETGKALSEAQQGYRKGKSCDTALARMEEELEGSADTNNVIVKLDMKGAFSNIKHSKIIEALEKKRLPANLVKLVASYLKDRTVHVKMQDEWEERRVVRGVGQGSALGPHLFIIATDEVHENVREMIEVGPELNKVSVYADDILISVARDTGTDTIEVASKAAEMYQQQLREVGLEIEPAKTEVSTAMDLEKVRLLGREIEVRHTVDFLGVKCNLNEQVNAEHVNMLTARLDRWMTQNSRVLSRFSRLDVEVRRQLYNTSILPMFRYGVETWARTLDSKVQAKLKTAMRRAAQMIVSASDKASWKSVVALAGVPTITEVCKADIQYKKAMREGKWGEVKIDKKRGYYLKHPHFRWLREAESTLETETEVESSKGDVNYFTDGSHFEQDEQWYTGAAVVREEEGEELQTTYIKLKPENTAQQAEQFAVRVALDLALGDHKNKTIRIFTDSLSTITAIFSGQQQTAQILRARDKLRKIEKRGTNIKVLHVRAHNDIQLNEAADLAAKQAAVEGTFYDVGVPPSFVKRETKKRAREEADLEWQQDRAGEVITKFFKQRGEPANKRVKVNMFTSQIYTGQGSNKTSRDLGYGRSEREMQCECGERQTTFHLITECKNRMRENIKVAKETGIGVLEFLGPVEDLIEMPKFHDYVEKRAKGLAIETRDSNRVDRTIGQVIWRMRNMSLNSGKQPAAAARIEDDYKLRANHFMVMMARTREAKEEDFIVRPEGDEMGEIYSLYSDRNVEELEWQSKQVVFNSHGDSMVSLDSCSSHPQDCLGQLIDDSDEDSNDEYRQR